VVQYLATHSTGHGQTSSVTSILHVLCERRTASNLRKAQVRTCAPFTWLQSNGINGKMAGSIDELTQGLAAVLRLGGETVQGNSAAPSDLSKAAVQGKSVKTYNLGNSM
jgi:hypothetical protein